MKSRAISRVVSIMCGLLLLAGAILKLEYPADAVGAIAHVLRPMAEFGQVAGRGLAFALIVGEAALGLALLLTPARAARAIAAVVFVGFAFVLVTRFSELNAPPCGCLGRVMQTEGPTHVWVDAARNMFFAIALLLTLRREAGAGTGRSSRLPQGIGGAQRAFTLIEMLVTIAIISLLVAITLPMLHKVRSNMRIAKSLAAQQQIVTAVHIYGQSNGDYFPHFRALDGVRGPVEIRGATVMEGYFRAHMGFWLAAFGPEDEAVIDLAIWPPNSRRKISASAAEAGLFYSVYFMTATAAADPALFMDPIASDPSPDPALLRGVRWSEMVFPSQKGLFLDFALMWNGERDQYVVASFGDGSAAELPGETPPLPIAPQPGVGPQTIVMSTRNGIRGIDR